MGKKIQIFAQDLKNAIFLPLNIIILSRLFMLAWQWQYSERRMPK